MSMPDLPFPRGQTFFWQQATPDANDPNALALRGRIYEIVDNPLPKSGRTATGRSIKLIVLQNLAAVALESKRLVTFKAGSEGLAVDGYATVDDALSLPVDDEYGSSTIPINDLFYAVLKGPCLILTSLGGDATNVFGVGARVNALTAATSGATTAGRIQLQALSAKTTLALADALANIVGRAGTARTTANTNTATLVYVNVKAWW